MPRKNTSFAKETEGRFSRIGNEIHCDSNPTGMSRKDGKKEKKNIYFPPINSTQSWEERHHSYGQIK
jgi:hypothetical protein